MSEITEVHLKLLLSIPDSKTAPEDGISIYPQEHLVLCGQMKEMGLLRFHPDAATGYKHDGSGIMQPDKRSTWTRSLAGDLSITCVLKLFNEYSKGEI